MMRVSVAAALLGALLVPPPAGAQGLTAAQARSVTAWVGERGVQDVGAGYERYRVGRCVRAGDAWRCDLVLLDDVPGFGTAGCLFKVTVRADATENARLDCTGGRRLRPARIDLPAATGSPATQPPPPGVELSTPSAQPAGEPFTRWADEARMPLVPYPVTLHTDEPCPRLGEGFYCVDSIDHLFFEPIETADEERGPRRYDFLHELGHLYEYTVFAWFPELRRRFVRVARVRSRIGDPDVPVGIGEKFAEAYASCSFDERRPMRFRAYRLYGWRPPAAAHRRMCAIIRASWRQFGQLEERPRRTRPERLQFAFPNAAQRSA